MGAKFLLASSHANLVLRDDARARSVQCFVRCSKFSSKRAGVAGDDDGSDDGSRGRVRSCDAGRSHGDHAGGRRREGRVGLGGFTDGGRMPARRTVTDGGYVRRLHEQLSRYERSRSARLRVHVAICVVHVAMSHPVPVEVNAAAVLPRSHA